MKKFGLFLVIFAVLFGGCGKNKTAQTPPKCDDEQVLKIVKEDFVEKYSSFCDPSEPQSKWCMAEQGEFSEITTVSSGDETKCEAWYSFGEYSYFFEYSAKFEKGKLVVERE